MEDRTDRRQQQRYRASEDVFAVGYVVQACDPVGLQIVVDGFTKLGKCGPGRRGEVELDGVDL